MSSSIRKMHVRMVWFYLTPRNTIFKNPGPMAGHSQKLARINRISKQLCIILGSLLLVFPSSTFEWPPWSSKPGEVYLSENSGRRILMTEGSCFGNSALGFRLPGLGPRIRNLVLRVFVSIECLRSCYLHETKMRLR